MEECHRLLTDQVDLVNTKGHRPVPDMSKPLPLGGPPGHITIQPQFFFNKDLEYLISGDTASRDALLISKLKAANYPDFRLEELVPSLSHMQILSVVSLKKFKRYSYAFMKEIVIRGANYKEYKISEAGFKNLHPNDFEDQYLLHLQGKLNHLPGSEKVHLYNAVNMWIRNIVIKQRVGDLQLGIESYQTKINLTQPNRDASNFLFKEDYTIVSKLRVIIYKMKLFEYNRGMENRIWSKDDKRRSEEFIENIRVIPKYHNEDENPARVNIKQALGSFQDQEKYEHVGPQDTRPQDGERSQDDDQRLDLADDLMKAQDHISSLNTSHKTKITTSKYKISSEESKTMS
ncbi:hypothetical protein Tco_1188208 [Tanacetum coccineum]